MICEKYLKEIPPFSTICPFCGQSDCISHARQRVIENTKARALPTPSTVSSPIQSGFVAFDAILDGRFSSGDVVIIGAPSGIGKSTFALQLANKVAQSGVRTLYFSGEMDERRVSDYQDRYHLSRSVVSFIYEVSLRELLVKVRTEGYQLLVIDSLQVLHDGSSHRPSPERQAQNIATIVKVAKSYGIGVLAISKVTKTGDIAGAYSAIHDVSVALDMTEGKNGEVIISVHGMKNRLTGDIGRRAIFRRTPIGLVPIEEIETGHILRHHNQESSAVPFPFYFAGVLGVEEISLATGCKSEKLVIAGKAKEASEFLAATLRQLISGIDIGWNIQATTMSLLGQYADLAICVGILAKHFKKKVPVKTAFMAAVDGEGNLVHLPGMDRLGDRAVRLGYTRVYGPEAIGSEVASWIPCASLIDVIESLGWREIV